MHEDVPIRMAATVMLVRDDEVSKDIEVFMMQRTLKAVFAGGLYVFPGGKLDDIDGGSHIEHLCDGLTDEEASGLLQIPSGGLAFWVAAIREKLAYCWLAIQKQVNTFASMTLRWPIGLRRIAMKCTMASWVCTNCATRSHFAWQPMPLSM
jgi:hypothetical protein